MLETDPIKDSSSLVEKPRASELPFNPLTDITAVDRRAMNSHRRVSRSIEESGTRSWIYHKYIRDAGVLGKIGEAETVLEPTELQAGASEEDISRWTMNALAYRLADPRRFIDLNISPETKKLVFEGVDGEGGVALSLLAEVMILFPGDKAEGIDNDAFKERFVEAMREERHIGEIEDFAMYAADARVVLGDIPELTPTPQEWDKLKKRLHFYRSRGEYGMFAELAADLSILAAWNVRIGGRGLEVRFKKEDLGIADADSGSEEGPALISLEEAFDTSKLDAESAELAARVLQERKNP